METKISDQADWMAKEIRNNTHTGKRIGDVLDQMERDHKLVEKHKVDRDLHNQQMESVSSRYTNTPRRVVEVQQPAPFNRDAAREQLKSVYPWLSPGHPENPDQIFHSYMAKRTAAQYEALTSNDLEAATKYRLGGAPSKIGGKDQ